MLIINSIYLKSTYFLIIGRTLEKNGRKLIFLVFDLRCFVDMDPGVDCEYFSRFIWSINTFIEIVNVVECSECCSYNNSQYNCCNARTKGSHSCFAHHTYFNMCHEIKIEKKKTYNLCSPYVYYSQIWRQVKKAFKHCL